MDIKKELHKIHKLERFITKVEKKLKNNDVATESYDSDDDDINKTIDAILVPDKKQQPTQVPYPIVVNSAKCKDTTFSDPKELADINDIADKLLIKTDNLRKEYADLTNLIK